MMGMGWPVSSYKWKAPLVYTSEQSVIKLSVGHQISRILVLLGYLQWNLNITKGQGIGKMCSL